jgi:hypothetical protein
MDTVDENETEDIKILGKYSAKYKILVFWEFVLLDKTETMKTVLFFKK